MRILYDHNAFTFQKFGGVSQCFVRLIEHLPEDVLYSIALKATDNIHISESSIINLKAEDFYTLDSFCNWMPRSLKTRLYYFLQKRFASFRSLYNINKSYSIELIQENNYDILHHTYFDPYFLEINKRPFVITVHDLIHERYNYSQKDAQIIGRKLLLPKAAHIVAVSEHTKKDIIDLYGIDPKKITVIHHGYDAFTGGYADLNIEFPFILYVGSRNTTYKNFRYFICECSKFIKTHSDFKIICTGNSFEEEELKLIEDIGLKGIVIHKFCTNAELHYLYKNAFAFVYPSLYEGFGIPILDAFYNNCPVILNNKSCFPEIGGDAALFFDSDDDKNSLSLILEKLYCTTDEQRCELILKGRERLKSFSWEKAGEQLRDVYNKILL